MKTATIITIGDEILSGNTVDTNSNFIAQQLKDIGIKVRYIFTISDEVEEIVQCLQKAVEASDLIITTGGLGPTKDDKTKQAYARFFKDKISFSEELYHKLGAYLYKKGRSELLALNKSQCEVLSTAKIFENSYGTAPCQLLERQGKLTFCLPGVPFEVKPLIKDQILPYLKQRWELHTIYTRIVSVVGLPESLLSNRIEDWELALPPHVSLSYLPVGSRVKLRLTATGKDRKELEEEVDQLLHPLRVLIGDNVIAWSEDAIENILASILWDRGLNISTVESCTSGQIARLLTSVPGSSRYYKGGIIPYLTHVKSQLLGISEDLIKKHSVVSKEVAVELARSCRDLFHTDIAISSTGVAGPDKGEDGKEVGTLYYAIAKGEEIRSFDLYLPGLERNDFVNMAVQKIIETLIVWLEEDNRTY
ncbi:CinA family nicotinamide mononucleotide deamidase-related protein [Elizabethkingia argentiflava]|uniref:CinA-like protein n=1 Tax=Elizabethkingia argenteiflava TaxID=2681556 RepID=A0A845PUE5_9FLAO|nr:CinA family nicotinamide mononucleotide deamidase-related protein [Elizabethkingia argenteiflava]NAW51444.1 CinA family nicotinamide mononucleotide deamidase-related protein [Elizabethkingia argenteiflava]